MTVVAEQSDQVSLHAEARGGYCMIEALATWLTHRRILRCDAVLWGHATEYVCLHVNVERAEDEAARRRAHRLIQLLARFTRSNPDLAQTHHFLEPLNSVRKHDRLERFDRHILDHCKRLISAIHVHLCLMLCHLLFCQAQPMHQILLTFPRFFQLLLQSHRGRARFCQLVDCLTRRLSIAWAGLASGLHP